MAVATTVAAAASVAAAVYAGSAAASAVVGLFACDSVAGVSGSISSVCLAATFGPF